MITLPGPLRGTRSALAAGARARWATLRRPRAGLPGRFLATGSLAVLAVAVISIPLVSIGHAKPALLVATFAGLASLLAVAWPAELFPSLALSACAAEYLASTVAAHRAPLGSVIAEAVGLYLFHSLSALAAVLPWGADVHPVVFRRWAWRLLPVLGASAPVALIEAVVDGSSGPHLLLALLAGLAGTGAIALPVLLLRRALRG